LPSTSIVSSPLAALRCKRGAELVDDRQRVISVSHVGINIIDLAIESLREAIPEMV